MLIYAMGSFEGTGVLVVTDKETFDKRHCLDGECHGEILEEVLGVPLAEEMENYYEVDGISFNEILRALGNHSGFEYSDELGEFGGLDNIHACIR